MQNSPKGREIRHVAGNPSEISSRGAAIEMLGTQMLEAADVLEEIKTRAIEDGTQKGKTIEKLRDTIGESYTVLREAGELYEPVGPVIKAYGDELGTVKPSLDAHADNCETLWTTFNSLPGDVEPRGTGGLFEPEEGSPEAQNQADEDAAKRDAHDAWLAEAQAFDSQYDTWEDAYDEAVSNIGDKMAGSIKDGFWEFLDDLGEILGWVAFAVGILAMIIGGPILAAIALGLAIAYLAVVLTQYLGGKKSLGDVALAALGVIPFGKVAKFSSIAKLLHFNKASFKALGKMPFSKFTALKGLLSKPKWGGLVATFKNRGASTALHELLLGSKSFKDVYRVHKSFYEGAGPALAAMRDLSSVRNLAVIDYVVTGGGTLLGHWGMIDKVTGNKSAPSIPGL